MMGCRSPHAEGWSLIDWQGAEHPTQDLLCSRRRTAPWLELERTSQQLSMGCYRHSIIRHRIRDRRHPQDAAWQQQRAPTGYLATRRGKPKRLDFGCTVCGQHSDGWSLARFDAEGNLDRMIRLPVPSPTDLCFVGKEGTTLYITSSRQELMLEVLGGAPDSGCLLQLEAEVAG